MKTLSLFLALEGLLGTAHAQTAPAKRQAVQQAPIASKAARAHAVVAANGKAIGRQFVTKSKPTGSRALRLPIQ